MPSLSAESLDEMYHTRTDWEPSGESAQRFERVLKLVQEAITDQAPESASYIRKSMLFSAFAFFEDLTRHAKASVNAPLVAQVGKAFWAEGEDEPKGPVSSSEYLAKHYKWFCEAKTAEIPIGWLASRRTFPDDMKELIWKAAVKQNPGGIPICPVCGAPVTRAEADFNHRKPWVLGGPTVPENGRVLHRRCNRSAGGALSGTAR